MITTPVVAVEVDRWRRLARGTGIAGLVTIVALFTPIVAISTQGEPSFDATAAEAQTFFSNGGAGWLQTASAVVGLAGIGVIWFVVGLGLLLARAEGSPPWRSAVAVASGLMLAAYQFLDVSWDAASYGNADLDPAVASYAFDVGNLGFANVWMAMGSFAICAGWVVLSTRMLGRWLGWWAVIAGAGLVLVRFAWEGELWFAPYALFWLWVIIVCVQLIRLRVVWPDPAA